MSYNNKDLHFISKLDKFLIHSFIYFHLILSDLYEILQSIIHLMLPYYWLVHIILLKHLCAMRFARAWFDSNNKWHRLLPKESMAYAGTKILKEEISISKK